LTILHGKCGLELAYFMGFRMLLSNRLNIELANSQTTLEFCTHLLDR
jgi:hypothetical protein